MSASASARRRRRQAPTVAGPRGGAGWILRVIGWCNLASSALCLFLLVSEWLFDRPLRVGSLTFGLLFVLCLSIGVLALQESRPGREAR